MLLSYFLYSLLFYRMYGETLFCEFYAQEEYHLSVSYHPTEEVSLLGFNVPEFELTCFISLGILLI